MPTAAGGVTMTTEVFEGGNLAPYCASSRFLHVRNMLESGEADILCMDIDVAEIHDFDRYLSAVRNKDVSLFQEGTIVPWLRQWATSIYFHRSATGRRYLEVYCQIIRHHLSDMAWFFDQAALTCTSNWMERNVGAGSVNLLTARDGFRLHDFIIPSGGLGEKLALRKGTGID